MTRITPIIDLSIWPEVSRDAPPPSVAALRSIAQAADDAGIALLSSPPPAPETPFEGDGGLATDWLATLTRYAGLATSVSAGREHPYNAARRIAALDHASKGRAGWAVSSAEAESEYVGLLRDLWDGWRDDAVFVDRSAAKIVRDGTVRHINHAGEKYRVRGPLPLARPPQGWPPLVLYATEPDLVPTGIDADLAVLPAGFLTGNRAAPNIPFLLRADGDQTVTNVLSHAEAAGAVGLSFRWRGPDESLRLIAELRSSFPGIKPRSGTLRERLGLHRPEINAELFIRSELFSFDPT